MPTIDNTKPPAGEALTADVRANFTAIIALMATSDAQIAANVAAIAALQADVIAAAANIAALSVTVEGTEMLLNAISAGTVDPLPVTSRTPLGVYASRNMAPVLQAAADFGNADEFFSDADGFRAFRVTALAVPAGEAVVVGWSNVAGDSTTLKATIDAITTATTGDWDVPSGAAFDGVMELTEAQPTSPWIYAYGTPDDAWVTLTDYAVGEFVRATEVNGFRYEATVGGTSGANEPTWPTTVGNTVTDGTVTWTCRGPVTIKSIGLQQTGGTLTAVIVETVA